MVDNSNKKTKKRIPLAVKIILIVVIAAVLVFGILIGRQLIEMSKMSALPTGELTAEVFAVNNQMVNIYLIKGVDGYIMIDAGADKTLTADAFEQLNVDPAEVKTILFTHTDSDHTGALTLFPDAQAYISDEEVQMIDGTTRRSILGGNSLSADYQTLAGGESVTLSELTVQCILTPGHTPGSMCYLIDGRYLFTGDTLSLKEGKVDLFNSFFNMDDEVQRSSLYTLAEFVSETQPEYIFTAHYGYSGNPSSAFADWQ